MKIRVLCAVVTGLACVALLSSCSLLSALPGVHGAGPDYSGQTADAKMRHIADAVNSHDVAALKKLFSQRAREKATDLDSGLGSLLSLFPSGRFTWKSEGPAASSGGSANGKRTVELLAFYKVSAGGKDYDLYFGDFTVNGDSTNVGIYSLGLAPYTSDPQTASGKPKPLFAWEHTGVPGVYISEK